MNRPLSPGPWPWFKAMLALSLLAALIAGAVFYWQARADQGLVRLTHVSVHGDLMRVPEQVVQARVRAFSDQGVLTIDVRELARQIERIPWVASASVRRVWPDGLAVDIQEHRPLAFWGDSDWLNDKAEVFKAPRPAANDPSSQGFSSLFAPPELAPSLASYLRQFAPHLSALGLRLRQMDSDARGALKLSLETAATNQDGSSFVADLGRLERERRFARFVHAWPVALKPLSARIARVDLRYPHGFAVAWRPTPAMPSDSAPATATHPSDSNV